MQHKVVLLGHGSPLGIHSRVMETAPEIPYGQDLLLVGGGHSHALALRMLGMRPIRGVRVTVVSDVSYAPYSGMLPGHVAGFYSWEEMHIDLRRLCAFAGAAFVQGRVEGLDVEGHAVHVAGRPPMRASVISLNVGSTPDLSAVPGAEGWAIPAKPVPELLAGWERIKAAAGRRDGCRVVIVGGGAGGVELALNMGHVLGRRAAITLLHEGERILPGHNERVREILSGLLPERGVTVRTSTRVTEVTAEGVRTAGGDFVAADFVVWVTQVAAPSWIAESGLATTEDGFVRVESTLQAIDHPWIFAVGDVATIEGEARPKSGVFAVRMAEPLVTNLRGWFSGWLIQKYQPQRQFLSLIGTGDGQAVASRRFLAGRSASFWKLKDWIDRRFMRKFEDLPVMQEDLTEPGEADRMRCLGCAAKVAGTTLTRVMDRLREEHGAAWQEAAHAGAVLVGLDAPDDAAAFSVPPGRVLVQTVDYMPALVSDPYLFGRIATIHGLSDLFAMGAEPHSALAAALVPFASEEVTEETLYQLLSGVLRELGAAGAVLAGGHSAEGSVVGLALTCNGLADPSRLLRKGGLRAGDALVLTKPLGTGVLFAAHMRLKAKSLWIDSAIDSMLISNRAAAAVLLDHGATGCTDVTGFGLAGHLLEMLRPAGLGAEIDIAAVPALPGALECLRRGLASSLSPANRSAAADIRWEGAGDSEGFSLLFDPQTSGGLLAGVPEERVEDCLEALRAAGYAHTARIGTVTRLAESSAALTLL